MVAELVGDEPLAEGVIGITEDAISPPAAHARRAVDPERHPDFPGATGHLRWSWRKPTVSPATRSGGGVVMTSASAARACSIFVLQLPCSGAVPLRHPTGPCSERPALLANVNLRSVASHTVGRRPMRPANAVAVYFELTVGTAKTLLSTHPSVVEESNHWLSPVRVLADPLKIREGYLFHIRRYRKIRMLDAMSGCRGPIYARAQLPARVEPPPTSRRDRGQIRRTRTRTGGLPEYLASFRGRVYADLASLVLSASPPSTAWVDGDFRGRCGHQPRSNLKSTMTASAIAV